MAASARDHRVSLGRYPRRLSSTPGFLGGPHLCRVPRLLPAGHAETAAAIPGARADTEIRAGQDGGDPDGRCATADHRWSHGHTVALHRTGGRSGHPAPAAENQLARSAATQGDRRRRSMIDTTRRGVVPTLAEPNMQNQTLGRFWLASSESRARHSARSLAIRGPPPPTPGLFGIYLRASK